MSAEAGICTACSHTHHGDRECDEVVGYDHMNGQHECGCPGENDELDLMLIEEPNKGPGFPVHVLVVEAVEDLDGLVENDRYTLDHGTCELRDDDCIVESTVRELGLRAALNGVWSTAPVELREYRIRGWVSKTPATPNGPEEWDAGIEEVDLKDEWPEGTEIPFKSDGSYGLPTEGTFVVRHMPEQEATDADT